jgi:CRISPR-associated protein Cas2
MADRTRYLVMYDIRDQRRLRHVHAVVLDYGDFLQYSVYLCDLTRAELVGLRAALRREIHADLDTISIFDLGPPQGRTARAVEHLGRPPRMPEPGAGIW